MKHIARLLEMNPCLSAILIMTGLALGAQAADESQSHRLPLEGKWKHTTSDSTQYSDPGFDDKDWIEADVARSRGCPIGPTSTDTRWYRTRFVIPDLFKPLAAKTGTLTLNFPDIMGQDVCWVNGREIGKTEEDTGAARFYLIRESDLNFDKANGLAVRVHHNPWAGFKPVPVLTETLPSHFLELSVGKELTNRFSPKDKTENYALRVDNKLNKPQPATVIASFQNGAGRELFAARKEVLLNTGKNLFDFEYKADVDMLKIVYTIKVAGFDSDPSVLNAVYGYQDLEYHPVDPVIGPLTKDRFLSATFNEQLITGWLGSRLDANINLRLKHVEEQKLLSGFVNRPGKQPYIGEHIGKFLEAACNSYQYSHDPELKVLIDRMAQQLIACQLSDGYLGTYSPSKYWTRWDGWTHKYCLIGLLSYYRISGYKPALESAEKIGDLMSSTFGTNPGQKDIIMEADGKEVGTMAGMATTSILDPMVDLYRYSGKAKYLDFCKYIVRSFDQANGPKIISSLNALGRVDKTANGKAYEMLSILAGLVKLYKVTGDETYLKPALIAWRDVVDNRLYITGSSSSHEYFKGDHELPAGEDANMAEGCVTTTWIQLNDQLFTLLGKIEFLDELERAVYNHLFGAENPRNGDVSYYTPLMGKKPFKDIICCCMSSIPRGIAMIPLFADGTLGDNPAILFYQPGVFRTTVGKTAVAFKTETRFPADGQVSITVDTATETRFALQLRIPYWSTDFAVSVNDVKQTVDSTEMATIDRLWKTGDKIDVSFAMPVTVLNGGKSYPGHVALKRGPQVLTFDQTLNTVDAAKVSIATVPVQLKEVEGALPQGWIGGQAYQVDAIADGVPTKIVMVPYCDASQSGGAVTTWLKKQPLVILQGDTPTESGVHGKGNVYAPDVCVVDGLWRMWYGGQGKDGHDRIHLAESQDGRVWKKRGMVLEDKEANHVNDPSVVRVGNEWWMYYTRAATDVLDEIALAVSRDGVVWEKRGIVLRPGAPGTWDALLVGRPSVLKENGRFKMWYDGRADLPPNAPATGVPKSPTSQRSVGYAESVDGIHWQRHGREPVFQDGAGAVHVAHIGSHYRMVYESHQGTKIAVSTDGLKWMARDFLLQNSGMPQDAHGQVTPFLWSDATGEARLFFGGAREAGWDCNLICFQTIQFVKERLE